MIHPPDARLIMAVPAVVLAVAALAVLVWLGAHVVRYLVADRQLRAGAAGRVADQVHVAAYRPPGRTGPDRADPPAVVVQPAAGHGRDPGVDPAVTVAAERWGVRVDASTVGRLGLEEFTQTPPGIWPTCGGCPS